MGFKDLTLVMVNSDISSSENIENPDQLAPEGIHTVSTLIENACLQLECCRLTGYRPLVKSVYQKNIFFHFSTKTYVAGTQKNRLNETVLLSTKNIC